MRTSKKVWFSLVSLCVALVVAEVLAAAWLRWYASEDDFRRYASIGQLEARYGAFDRFQAHRHLGYALSPNYKAGKNRHNALGYRGDEFTEAKPEGVKRVVCCGGSTTYGFGYVENKSRSAVAPGGDSIGAQLASPNSCNTAPQHRPAR